MHSFEILNVLAFQNCAWLGCVPKHLRILGAFVTRTMKLFTEILIVKGLLYLNFS
jgi:hypothetical protein